MKNLGKRFGDRWIFRHMAFEVVPGQRLLIIGNNGSGKSTLLRTLAGLLSPSEGSVHLDVEDARTALGYSALDFALYPSLTSVEHLQLTGDLRGVPPNSAALLDRVGLGYAPDVPAGHLSTGMRARLKLALAIQANPPLLLLDEPGASLDERGRELIASVVEEQSVRGAVVIASNDPLERRFATHELLLEN